MDGKPTHTHLAEKKEKKSKRKPKAPWQRRLWREYRLEVAWSLTLMNIE